MFDCRTVSAVIVYTIIVWQVASLFKSEDDLKGERNVRAREINLSISTINTTNNSFCVEKRLKTSNMNWQRAKKAREELERSNPLDEEDIWNWKTEVSLWDFFYAAYDCPHTLERIGRSGDGGKWICGVNHLALKPNPCFVYSFGVNDDFSFEEEILERTNCSVYMFDHTIHVRDVNLPKRYPGRVSVEKMGLGPSDTDSVRSLESHMMKYGHKFIDILKMDIEGAETEVMEKLKNDFPVNVPFGQLALEIHTNRPHRGFYPIFKKWFENLESMGLRAYKNELNLWGARFTRTKLPYFIEYSFININTDNWFLH